MPAQPNSGLIRPFLRWVGGKQKLLPSLLAFTPHKQFFNRYFEPFFGGGALFFGVQPDIAVVSDINEELMLCYQHVAKNPQLVANLLQRYARKDCAEFFYRIRSRSLNSMSPEGRAARFIYLNKAAFNGIYRVNSQGQFNVPYGPSVNGPAIPRKELLISAAQYLRRAVIRWGDFEEAVMEATKGDFVYLDPPYPPRSKTAFFTHYSADKFSWKHQERVATVFSKLHNRGCLVMLSNADQKKVTALYKGFNVYKLNVIRWLGSNGDRFRVREVVITNYNPSEFVNSEL